MMFPLLQYANLKSSLSHRKVYNMLDTSRGCAYNEGRDKDIKNCVN